MRLTSGLQNDLHKTSFALHSLKTQINIKDSNINFTDMRATSLRMPMRNFCATDKVAKISNAYRMANHVLHIRHNLAGIKIH